MTDKERIVCFFGIYDPGYARNQVLMEGFRAHGWRVLECRADPHRRRGHAKYTELVRRWWSVRREYPDLVIVAFPGHTVVWLARLLFGRRIVFDAFLSLYDSNVFDRKVHAERSIAAWLDWVWDWSSCRLAHRVLLDTAAHIDYFAETFGTPREKCIRVWIGANEHVFHPRAVQLSRDFTVHFHGTFIPLQGISYILDAAHLLKEEHVHFRFVGHGQQFVDMQKKAGRLGLTNVEFMGGVTLEAVPGYVASAHIALGIFGDTEKTMRVVPNKVFEQMAMGVPTITADTPAIRELEVYGKAPLMLVPPADGAALAAAIRALRDDPARRARLGRDAAEFFHDHISAREVVADLLMGIGGGVLAGKEVR